MVDFKTYNVTNWTTNQLKYAYCPLSEEVKAIRQRNLAS